MSLAFIAATIWSQFRLLDARVVGALADQQRADDLVGVGAAATPT